MHNYGNGPDEKRPTNVRKYRKAFKEENLALELQKFQSMSGYASPRKRMSSMKKWRCRHWKKYWKSWS